MASSIVGAGGTCENVPTSEAIYAHHAHRTARRSMALELAAGFVSGLASDLVLEEKHEYAVFTPSQCFVCGLSFSACVL